jgi:ligand-binding SRPBCC domain-containing protein
MSHLRTLEREKWIPRPLEEVFYFFGDAENLEKITPPWLNFRILTSRPIQMTVGAKIVYQMRLHGVLMRWTSEILEWKPPFGFVDVQLKGPYRLWHHSHSFTKQHNGTLMKDLVRYELPFGWLGRIAHALTVRKNLDEIFDYRFRAISEIFAGPEHGREVSQEESRSG